MSIKYLVSNIKKAAMCLHCPPAPALHEQCILATLALSLWICNLPYISCGLDCKELVWRHMAHTSIVVEVHSVLPCKIICLAFRTSSPSITHLDRMLPPIKEMNSTKLRVIPAIFTLNKQKDS